MASILAQRDVVISMYPNSKKWAEQVNKMPDDQVCAIYLRNLRTVEREIEDKQRQDEQPERTLSPGQDRLF